jgi:hypothetical protein
MKYLPLAMIRGPLLGEVIRGAALNGCSHCLCGWCGTSLRSTPERGDQTVQCPGCARQQRVTTQREEPWRLTPSAAEALRRTRSWLRRV